MTPREHARATVIAKALVQLSPSQHPVVIAKALKMLGYNRNEATDVLHGAMDILQERERTEG